MISREDFDLLQLEGKDYFNTSLTMTGMTLDQMYQYCKGIDRLLIKINEQIEVRKDKVQDNNEQGQNQQ